MSVLDKLDALGISIAAINPPAANYSPAVVTGNLLFTAGQVCKRDGEMAYKGKLGADVSNEDGYEAAKLCAANALAVVHHYGGGLDNVVKIVKATVFVNAIPDFAGHAYVANGATDLLVALFGPEGCPARSAVGMGSLPGRAACEVELIAELKVPPVQAHPKALP